VFCYNLLTLQFDLLLWLAVDGSLSFHFVDPVSVVSPEDHDDPTDDRNGDYESTREPKVTPIEL
jgi:hypothetical protein